MKYMLMLVMGFSMTNCWADDAETNMVAKQIKNKVTKSIKRLNGDAYEGYCDLMIEMRHKGRVAIIHRISSSGDYKLCKASKRSLKKGLRFKYEYKEKFVRIHITNI